MSYRDMYQGRTLQVGDAAYIKDGYSSYIQITKATVTKVTKTTVTVEWGQDSWKYTVVFRWSEADEVYREVKQGVKTWNKDYLVTEDYALKAKATKDRETRRNKVSAAIREASSELQTRYMDAELVAGVILKLQQLQAELAAIDGEVK